MSQTHFFSNFTASSLSAVTIRLVLKWTATWTKKTTKKLYDFSTLWLSALTNKLILQWMTHPHWPQPPEQKKEEKTQPFLHDFRTWCQPWQTSWHQNERQPLVNSHHQKWNWHWGSPALRRTHLWRLRWCLPGRRKAGPSQTPWAPVSCHQRDWQTPTDALACWNLWDIECKYEPS